MNRLKLNYFIDLLMLISFLVTGISAVIASVFLPVGFSQAGQQLFLGLSRRSWMSIHGLFGYVFIILVFIHLILHWNWIIQVTKSLFKTEQQN